MSIELENMVTVISNVTDMLKADSRTATRIQDTDTDNPKTLTVDYYQFIDFREVYEEVKLEEEHASTPTLPTPAVAIHFPEINLDPKVRGRWLVIEPLWYIDVVVSNATVAQARIDCFLFCAEILKVLHNKNAKFTVNHIYVSKVERIGSIIKKDLPVEYFYRMTLKSRTQ